jgi:restriction endonuclease Mrr
VLAANIALERTASIRAAADWRLYPSVVITDERVIRYLDEHPEEIHRLTPREFETFVAGLLERFGYEVHLGPKGADGGVDIHGFRHEAVRSEYLVVQCKRYAPERRVALPLVKQLRMDALDRRASCGLFVTTSWFTREALSYINTYKYQLSPVDSDELRLWMRRLSGRTV